MNDIFLKLIVNILKNYMNFIMIYHVYQKEWKLKKFIANLHDKTEYLIHIRNLKETSNHELVLKKVHGVINFNQNAWLKSYIDININLRKKAKRILKRI